MMRSRLAKGDRMITRSLDARESSQFTNPKGAFAVGLESPVFSSDLLEWTACNDIAFPSSSGLSCNNRTIWCNSARSKCPDGEPAVSRGCPAKQLDGVERFT